jgi:hypothetical protein
VALVDLSIPSIDDRHASDRGRRHATVIVALPAALCEELLTLQL